MSGFRNMTATSDEQTSWKERREFEERLAEGLGLTVAEVQRLIDDADAGERATAIVEALEEALASQLGVVVVDATTDDDDGAIRLELVRAEEPSEPRDSIGE